MVNGSGDGLLSVTGAGLEKEYRPNGSGQAKATEDGEG